MPARERLSPTGGGQRRKRFCLPSPLPGAFNNVNVDALDGPLVMNQTARFRVSFGTDGELPIWQPGPSFQQAARSDGGWGGCFPAHVVLQAERVGGGIN